MATRCIVCGDLTLDASARCDSCQQLHNILEETNKQYEPLTWTDEPPEVPGFYALWYAEAKSPRIFKVYRGVSGLLRTLDDGDLHSVNGRWLGPLPEVPND